MRQVAVLLVVALISACGSSQRKSSHPVSKKDFGDQWPLTVDEGVLACDGSSSAGAVTFEAGGRVYGVNGTAMTWKRGQDIDPIWAPGEAVWVIDPTTKRKVNVGQQKKSIGPLIEAGLALCRKP